MTDGRIEGLASASFNGWGSSSFVRDVPNRAANCDEGFSYALFYAAEDGNLELATPWLDEGACINARNRDGWTALHRAAKSDALSVVRLLVERGTDVTIKARSGHVAADLAWGDVKVFLMKEMEKQEAEAASEGATITVPKKEVEFASSYTCIMS